MSFVLSSHIISCLCVQCNRTTRNLALDRSGTSTMYKLFIDGDWYIEGAQQLREQLAQHVGPYLEMQGVGGGCGHCAPCFEGGSATGGHECDTPACTACTPAFLMRLILGPLGKKAVPSPPLVPFMHTISCTFLFESVHDWCIPVKLDSCTLQHPYNGISGKWTCGIVPRPHPPHLSLFLSPSLSQTPDYYVPRVIRSEAASGDDATVKFVGVVHEVIGPHGVPRLSRDAMIIVNVRSIPI